MEDDPCHHQPSDQPGGNLLTPLFVVTGCRTMVPQAQKQQQQPQKTPGGNVDVDAASARRAAIMQGVAAAAIGSRECPLATSPRGISSSPSSSSSSLSFPSSPAAPDSHTQDSSSSRSGRLQNHHANPPPPARKYQQAQMSPNALLRPSWLDLDLAANPFVSRASTISGALAPTLQAHNGARPATDQAYDGCQARMTARHGSACALESLSRVGEQTTDTGLTKGNAVANGTPSTAGDVIDLTQDDYVEVEGDEDDSEDAFPMNVDDWDLFAVTPSPRCESSLAATVVETSRSGWQTSSTGSVLGASSSELDLDLDLVPESILAASSSSSSSPSFTPPKTPASLIKPAPLETPSPTPLRSVSSLKRALGGDSGAVDPESPSAEKRPRVVGAAPLPKTLLFSASGAPIEPTIDVELPAAFAALERVVSPRRGSPGASSPTTVVSESHVRYDTLLQDWKDRPWSLQFRPEGGSTWLKHKLVATKDIHTRPARSRAYRLHSADAFLWLSWPHRDASSRLLETWLTRTIRFKDPVTGHERHFKFFGSTDSRLRDVPSFGFVDEAVLGMPIRELYESFGDLGAVWRASGPGKWTARLGLSFTDTLPTIVIEENEFVVLPDVIAPDGKAYTDGCACMTEEAASEVAQLLGIRGSVPRAFQIRFAGCKGMLVVHSQSNLRRFFPEAYRDDIKIYLRQSQVKYQAPNHRILEIKDWAKSSPKHGARLQKSYILLLECLGLPLAPIEAHLQAELDRLKACLVDRSEAIGLLSRTTFIGPGHPDGAQRLLHMLCAGHDLAEPFVAHEIEAYLKIELDRLRTKLNIRVPSSATLFGVCDDSKQLRAGEAFVNINGIYVTGPILVTRSPAYHPGDIRLLNAIRPASGIAYADCIVFPLDGPQPTADMMGGGDLDGDTFTVIWDETLFPPRIFPPDTRGAPSQTITKRSSLFSHSELIQHMIDRTADGTLGAISNEWDKVAESSASGPRDPFCLALASAAELALDSSKSGMGRQAIPKRKERPERPLRTKGPIAVLAGQVYLFKDGDTRPQGVRTDLDLLYMEAGLLWEQEYRKAAVVREEWADEFRKIFRSANEPMCRVAETSFGKTKALKNASREKRSQIEALWSKYVRRYYSCTGPQNYRRLEVRASAWYASIYDGYDAGRHDAMRRRKLQRWELNTKPIPDGRMMFAWLGCDYLNRIKADAVNRRGGIPLPAPAISVVAADRVRRFM